MQKYIFYDSLYSFLCPRKHDFLPDIYQPFLLSSYIFYPRKILPAILLYTSILTATTHFLYYLKQSQSSTGKKVFQRSESAASLEYFFPSAYLPINSNQNHHILNLIPFVSFCVNFILSIKTAFSFTKISFCSTSIKYTSIIKSLSFNCIPLTPTAVFFFSGISSK